MEYSDSVLEESFQQASEYVRTGKFSATQDQQLLFYAYFKQATAGDAQSENAPSFFDFAGKAKFAAWSNLIEPNWLTGGSGHKPQKREKWICSSTMKQDEDNTLLSDKSICELVAENDEQNALKLLSSNPQLVNFTDDENRTPLHFAVDRANINLINTLLQLNANINAQDNEGQTPLHYACACEHASVIELLISHGADATIRDNEGQTAESLCDESLVAAFNRSNINH